MKRRLSTGSFEAYLAALGLPAGGEQICRRSWAATGPSRKVRSNRHHGSARIASTKTGRSRDAESFAEYRVYKLFEYRAAVLWYLAQPADKVLRQWGTADEDGIVRFSPVWATLDAFVLWRDRAPGWVDIKTLSKIEAAIEEHPAFFVREPDGWHCPSGDAYAAQFGLSYSVIVIDELNPIEVANADYLRASLELEVPVAVVDALRDRVAKRPGITLADLCREGFLVDHVCAAIFAGEVFVDLTRYQLRNQELAFVYLNPTVAAGMPAPLVVAVGGKRPGPVHVAAGEQVLWQGGQYVIDAAGASTIRLRPIEGGGPAVNRSRTDLARDVRSGAMAGLGPVDAEARAKLELLEARYGSADADATDRAGERLAALEAYWAGERECFPPVGGQVPTLAAVRDWQTRYRQMEELGSGFAGLLDLPQQGRPGSHLQASTQDVIAKVAESFFMTPGRLASVAAFHRVVTATASARGVVPPSYPAVLTWTKNQPQYAQKRTRHGHKGAASAKPWAPLDPESAPPNGQFPGHIAHGDATVGDIWCPERFTREGSLRPSVFRLVDGLSGKRLGRAWHFGEVDEGVVLDALGDQIRTCGFLSQVYVLDSALVHKTTRVQKFLKKHGSDVAYRKTSDGRGGLPVERDFGRINTDLLHVLRGNTQISRDVRAMDRELDPRGHAIWPLADLIAAVDARDALVERERVVPALRQTTAEAWEIRYEHGMREARLVRWTPAIERELAVRHSHRPKVSPVNGIWVNRLYYWSDVFLHPSLEGVQLDASTIRRDIGRVWAFVPRHTVAGVNQPAAWVECVCRSPIAREHVTYEELAFFTKVVLEFNAGQYQRKQIENGKLGELLCNVLEREAELIEEQAKVRARSGRSRAKLPDLPRGDVLADAPEPVALAANGPVLTVIDGAGPARAAATAARALARIRFGSGARRREDDFLPASSDPLS